GGPARGLARGRRLGGAARREDAAGARRAGHGAPGADARGARRVARARRTAGAQRLSRARQALVGGAPSRPLAFLRIRTSPNARRQSPAAPTGPARPGTLSRARPAPRRPGGA